ncbi:hypothetical protein FWP33_13060 [Vibrio parahaemolyticus]|nr:hypothetical protein [Vibrio parahaemolyticus]EJE4724363.1 hypothetical protein [Vibrio parahaemolyticus]EJO2025545.1 hypothetical protein [Vibrio parahaemolyticus]ELA8176488.1 hypothetical protein [Vibrio alginolyticus]
MKNSENTIVHIGTTLDQINNVKLIEGLDTSYFIKRKEKARPNQALPHRKVMILDTHPVDNHQLTDVAKVLGLTEEAVKESIICLLNIDDYPRTPQTILTLTVGHDCFDKLMAFNGAYINESNDNTIYFDTYGNEQLAQEIVTLTSHQKESLVDSYIAIIKD